MAGTDRAPSWCTILSTLNRPHHQSDDSASASAPRVHDLSRYHRQMLLPGVGEEGQHRLAASHALIVGCGALGCAVADALVRAGVGTLTIVDRDVVERTNLQRQVLFDERDVERGLPKAEAAKARLNAVNTEVAVHAHVRDFNHRNARVLSEGADVIVDGLDNFETRYLLNDLAVATGRPYVYGGAVGTTGMSFTILPHETRDAGEREAGAARRVAWTATQATPCLRCVFPEAPPPGTTPTCDTAGVLGPAVSMIAAWQAAQTIKILIGAIDAVDRQMLSLDLWSNAVRCFDIAGARRDDCPCCGERHFPYLDGEGVSGAMTLCGRDAVQILPVARRDGAAAAIDLDAMARRLADHGSFICNRYLLHGTFTAERGRDDAAVELTLFPDGRAIIKGVATPDAARSIYARFIGG